PPASPPTPLVPPPPPPAPGPGGGGVLAARSVQRLARHTAALAVASHGAGGAWGTWTTTAQSRAPRPVDVYAATMTGAVNWRLAALPPRVYVPNSGDGTVAVIDPTTFRVVDRF